MRACSRGRRLRFASPSGSKSPQLAEQLASRVPTGCILNHASKVSQNCGFLNASDHSLESQLSVERGLTSVVGSSRVAYDGASQILQISFFTRKHISESWVTKARVAFAEGTVTSSMRSSSWSCQAFGECRKADGIHIPEGL